MNNYILQESIGQGQFSRVYAAIHKSTNTRVALKLVAKPPLTQTLSTHSDFITLAALKEEVKLQRELKHDNILRLLACFDSPTDVVFVSELCSCDLYQLLKKNGKLSYSKVQNISIQLLNGLEYLYNCNYIHRDLKLQNILVAENVYKICDFGFTKRLENHEFITMSIKGTPIYMAPELIKEEPYNYLVDIWAYGIILYELFCGLPPFYTTNIFNLVNLILNQQIKWPNKINPQFQDFLSQILEKVPQSRLGFPLLSNHPFITRNPNSPKKMNNSKQSNNETTIEVMNNESIITNQVKNETTNTLSDSQPPATTKRVDSAVDVLAKPNQSSTSISQLPRLRQISNEQTPSIDSNQTKQATFPNSIPLPSINQSNDSQIITSRQSQNSTLNQSSKQSQMNDNLVQASRESHSHSINRTSHKSIQLPKLIDLISSDEPNWQSIKQNIPLDYVSLFSDSNLIRTFTTQLTTNPQNDQHSLIQLETGITFIDTIIINRIELTSVGYIQKSIKQISVWSIHLIKTILTSSHPDLNKFIKSISNLCSCITSISTYQSTSQESDAYKMEWFPNTYSQLLFPLLSKSFKQNTTKETIILFKLFLQIVSFYPKEQCSLYIQDLFDTRLMNDFCEFVKGYHNDSIEILDELCMILCTVSSISFIQNEMFDAYCYSLSDCFSTSNLFNEIIESMNESDIEMIESFCYIIMIHNRTINCISRNKSVIQMLLNVSSSDSFEDTLREKCTITLCHIFQNVKVSTDEYRDWINKKLSTLMNVLFPFNKPLPILNINGMYKGINPYQNEPMHTFNYLKYCVLGIVEYKLDMDSDSLCLYLFYKINQTKSQTSIESIESIQSINMNDLLLLFNDTRTDVKMIAIIYITTHLLKQPHAFFKKFVKDDITKLMNHVNQIQFNKNCVSKTFMCFYQRFGNGLNLVDDYVKSLMILMYLVQLNDASYVYIDTLFCIVPFMKHVELGSLFYFFGVFCSYAKYHSVSMKQFIESFGDLDHLFELVLMLKKGSSGRFRVVEGAFKELGIETGTRFLE